MARILIADEPEGVTFLKRLLAEQHDLTVVATMKDAASNLEQHSFDLIVIGVHFDDSRMFELMSKCRNMPKLTDTPIICFCARNTPLTRTMHESIDVSSRAFGAWMYLDQHEYNVKRNPDAELRRVIERCLVGTERKKLQEHRIDIQEQREALLQLRECLEEEVWSVSLEDRVADLRQKLSEVLLELSKVQMSSVNQDQKLAESKDLDDQVSPHVKLDENNMARAERRQLLEESQQLAKEQIMVPTEEERAKEGRRNVARKQQERQ